MGRSGRYSGVESSLDKETTTVRRDSSCELVLSEETVSGCHAKIERAGDSYTVADSGSTNGTFVNDQQVAVGGLKNGDVLRFDKWEFDFDDGTKDMRAELMGLLRLPYQNIVCQWSELPAHNLDLIVHDISRTDKTFCGYLQLALRANQLFMLFRDGKMVGAGREHAGFLEATDFQTFFSISKSNAQIKVAVCRAESRLLDILCVVFKETADRKEVVDGDSVDQLMQSIMGSASSGIISVVAGDTLSLVKLADGQPSDLYLTDRASKDGDVVEELISGVKGAAKGGKMTLEFYADLTEGDWSDEFFIPPDHIGTMVEICQDAFGTVSEAAEGSGESAAQLGARALGRAYAELPDLFQGVGLTPDGFNFDGDRFIANTAAVKMAGRIETVRDGLIRLMTDYLTNAKDINRSVQKILDREFGDFAKKYQKKISASNLSGFVTELISG